MRFEQKPLHELEERIGYTFRDKSIVTEALTHSSYYNEMKAKGEKITFNERLEVLGIRCSPLWAAPISLKNTETSRKAT